MFDREFRFRHQLIVAGLYLVIDYFGFIPNGGGSTSLDGSGVFLLMGLGFLLLALLIYIRDVPQNYFESTRKVFSFDFEWPFRFDSRRTGSFLPFQFTATHALVALVLIVLTLTIVELFFDVINWSIVLVLLVVGVLPALALVFRRLGLRAGMNTGSNLTRDLARKMPGRSSEDMTAGALAAIAALCDMLENERILGPEEINRRIKRAFPNTSESWLTGCMKLAAAANVDPGRDIISASEFYANLLASQSKIPLRKLRIVEWSLGLLYSILYADGVISRSEHEIFAEIAGHFGIGSSKLEEIKRQARFSSAYETWSESESSGSGKSKFRGSENRSKQESSHQSDGSTRPHENPFTAALGLFNLKPGFSRVSLDKEWKRILKTNHPDRFHFTSPELYRQAHERFLKYSAAYELLKGRVPE
ncbi:MAG: hypothetical protein JNM27_14005 [Leptospirales bacterium]|nr:hypothetical protein [Leptospirales bacterium]